MDMWSLIESFFNSFEWNSNTWWFQFWGLIGICYFFAKSFIKTIHALKDKDHEAGVFPALGIVYMILSVSFVLSMVGAFDNIIAIFVKNFECLYQIPYSTAYSCVPSETNSIYLQKHDQVFLTKLKETIPSTLLWILLAFSINFSKSFYTLNTLELGLIPGSNYKSEKLNDVFGTDGKSLSEIVEKYFQGSRIAKWTILQRIKAKTFFSIYECTIRLFVAFAFIAIEKEFSEIGKQFKGSENVNVVISVFSNLSIEMVLLYVLVLMWALPFLVFAENKWWKIGLGIQIAVGIFLAYYYYSISSLSSITDERFAEYKSWFLENSQTMKTVSIILIAVIVLIELFGWIKLLRSFGNKSQIAANSDEQIEENGTARI